MHVDFFIAGGQKCGTTVLDALLRKHPSVHMAGKKEPHFFDNESIDWSAPDYRILHQHYNWSDKNLMRGEATPIYTYWPSALERIQSYHPGAKLIFALRHPAHRAFSHWRMETTRHAETLPFEKAMREGRARVRSAPRGVHRVYSYVERGFYAEQIARLLSLFPSTQILFLRTDALWRDPKSTLDRVQTFLGLPVRSLAKTPEYIVPLQSRAFGTLPASALQELKDLFTADIIETSRLTGLPLLDWLDPDYSEPMTPGEP